MLQTVDPYMWGAMLAFAVLLADTAWRSWASGERVCDTPHPGVVDAPAPVALGGHRVLFGMPLPPDVHDCNSHEPYTRLVEKADPVWERRRRRAIADATGPLEPITGDEAALVEAWHADVTSGAEGTLVEAEPVVDPEVAALFAAWEADIRGQIREALEPYVRQTRLWLLRDGRSTARQDLDRWRMDTPTGEWPIVRPRATVA